MSHDKLTVFVPGIPQPQGSKRVVQPRGCKRPLLIDASPKLHPWRKACHDAFGYAAKMHGVCEWDCPIGFKATFWFPAAKCNMRKDGNAKQRWAVTDADMDKLTRAVWDSLTSANVIRDDSRICQIMETQKMVCNQGQRPGVEVTIWRLPELQPGELPEAAIHSESERRD